MEEKDEKLVEIARFAFAADAQTLVAYLKSEGIDCYLRDEISSQILAGYADVGGVRVEVLENEVPQALKVMEEGGYASYEPEPEASPAERAGNWLSRLPLLRKLSPGGQITLILVLIIILVGLMAYFSAPK
ncbi:MAG: DUF2007 domain-containing protein [Tannerella sp.]|jgi:hypothetical protein|nr:DUF2007 domain-containing protein [Tannerella sp.]